MSTTTKFLKGSLLLGVASIVVRLSGILVLVPLARLLGAEQLGIYSLVFWIVQSGTAVGRIGVDAAIHRNGAQIYQTDPVATGRLLGTGSLLMGLSFTTLSASVWIWRFPLAEHWLANKDAAIWFGYAATILFVEGMSLIVMTGLLSLHQFRGNSFTTSVGAIGRLLFSPLLAWHYGVSGALWGLILASLLQLGTSLIIFWRRIHRSDIRLSCQGFWKESQQILKFGLPFWVGNALIALLVLPIMGEIGRVAGADSLGELRIAQSLSQVVGFLPGAIAPVAISILSEQYTSDDENQDFQRLRSLHLRGNWLLALFIVTFLSLACKSLVSLLFGSAYQAAVPLVIGMSWLALLTVIVENLNLYSLSAGNTLSISVGSIIQKVAVIGFSFLLIPQFEGMGYAFSLIIGGSFQLMIILASLWTELGEIVQKQFITLFTWSVIVCGLTFISILFELDIFAKAFLLLSIILILLLSFSMSLTKDERNNLLSRLSFWSV